jgi:hypothetical protein
MSLVTKGMNTNLLIVEGLGTGGLVLPIPVAAHFLVPGDILNPHSYIRIPVILGTYLRLLHSPLHLPATTSSANIYIKNVIFDTTGVQTLSGTVISPGVVVADQTYTPTVEFVLTSGFTGSLLQETLYVFEIQLTTTTGEVYATSIGGELQVLSGGPLG